MNNNNILYFYPEINAMLKNKIDIEDAIYHEKDIFLEKSKNGENDTLACKIIQVDLFDDFILKLHYLHRYLLIFSVKLTSFKPHNYFYKTLQLKYLTIILNSKT